jgi:hypothetical protein
MTNLNRLESQIEKVAKLMEQQNKLLKEIAVALNRR